MPDLSEFLRIAAPGALRDAASRSYLADGRCVGWYGDPAAVIDAELVVQPVPPRLAARYGVQDFWPRWTQAECAAKLAGISIATWLRRHGLPQVVAELRVERVLLPDVSGNNEALVSVAWRASDVS